MNFSSCFVSAIGTDSGKTLLSAILVKALKAQYWKPIQCGFPKDSDTIRNLTQMPSAILPEWKVFETPASPHFASKKENQSIFISDIELPKIVNGPLVVEGAGGLLVPLNEKETMADLIHHLRLPLVLVINHYLGSLNHTLLTLEAIKNRKLPLAGIVFNGVDFQNAEDIILRNTSVPVLFRLENWEKVDAESIEIFSRTLN